MKRRYILSLVVLTSACTDSRIVEPRFRPIVSIDPLEPGQCGPAQTITGSVSNGIRVMVNGSLAVTRGPRWSYDILLAPGQNTVEALADADGGSSIATRIIEYVGLAGAQTVTAFDSECSPEVSFAGSKSPGASVSANGIEVARADGESTFEATIQISPGTEDIILDAIEGCGSSSPASVAASVDTTALGVSLTSTHALSSAQGSLPIGFRLVGPTGTAEVHLAAEGRPISAPVRLTNGQNSLLFHSTNLTDGLHDVCVVASSPCGVTARACFSAQVANDLIVLNRPLTIPVGTHHGAEQFGIVATSTGAVAIWAETYDGQRRKDLQLRFVGNDGVLGPLRTVPLPDHQAIVEFGVARGPDDQLHVLVSGSTGGRRATELHYVRLGRNGSWSSPVRIAQGREYKRQPDVAVNQSGSVYITWAQRATYSSGGYGVHLATIANQDPNTLRAEVIVDASVRAFEPRLAINPHGCPDLAFGAWSDLLDSGSDSGRIYYLKGAGDELGGCSFEAPVEMASGAGGGISWSLALASDRTAPDRQWMIFLSTRNGTRQVWLQNIEDGRPGPPQVLSRAGTRATSPWGAVGANGEVHVVWQRETTLGGRVADIEAVHSDGARISPATTEWRTGDSNAQPRVAVTDGPTGKRFVIWRSSGPPRGVPVSFALTVRVTDRP